MKRAGVGERLVGLDLRAHFSSWCPIHVFWAHAFSLGRDESLVGPPSAPGAYSVCSARVRVVRWEGGVGREGKAKGEEGDAVEEMEGGRDEGGRKAVT